MTKDGSSPLVGIVMGSSSDHDVMVGAAEALTVLLAAARQKRAATAADQDNDVQHRHQPPLTTSTAPMIKGLNQP